MNRRFVNKIPGYHESNAMLYMNNWRTRSCEVKWKICNNYQNRRRDSHVLSWVPALGEPEPDAANCEQCLVENKCSCDGTDLLRYGCRCGGK